MQLEKSCFTEILSILGLEVFWESLSKHCFHSEPQDTYFKNEECFKVYLYGSGFLIASHSLEGLLWPSLFLSLCLFCKVNSFLVKGQISVRCSFFFCPALWGISLERFINPLHIHPNYLHGCSGVQKICVPLLDGSSMTLFCLWTQIIWNQSVGFFVLKKSIPCSYLNPCYIFQLVIFLAVRLCLCYGLNCTPTQIHMLQC